MESFNFVRALKKQMNKVFQGQPIGRYRQVWEQLQISIEGEKGKNKNPRIRVPRNMSEVRKNLKLPKPLMVLEWYSRLWKITCVEECAFAGRHFSRVERGVTHALVAAQTSYGSGVVFPVMEDHILIELLVDEMRDRHYERVEGRVQISRGGQSTAPPCYEFILRNEVIKTLCRWAKEPGLDLIMIHHIVDITMFVSPALLSHFKQATEPLIDLLQHTESRLQLWAVSDQRDVNHHTRCLSHGFIQLLYCIASKISDITAVDCVEFFFVDVRKFQFCEELTASACSQKQILTLLDFAIPYLKRRDEVVAASEIDYTWDLTDRDRTYQIYTSEIAVKVLSVILGLQHSHVTRYLDEKAEFVSMLFCQSIQDLCLELLDTESHCDDEYRTKDVLYDNVQRRLEILMIVSLTPDNRSDYVKEFLIAYESKIITEIFEKRMSASGDEISSELIELSVFLLEGLPQNPFCSALLDVIFKDPIKNKLLKGIMSDDADLVFISLRLFTVILKIDPSRGLNGFVSGYVSKPPPERTSDVTSDHVDALFHSLLFISKGFDQPSLEDAHAMHGVIRDSLSFESISKTEIEKCSDDDVVNQLPFLTIQRFTTLLDQPLRITLSLLDLVTTMVHLNYEPLTHYLFAVKNDRFLTLVQALQSLRTVIDGTVQQLGTADFKIRYEEMRKHMGVVSAVPGHVWEAPDTEESKIIEASVLLEEWRRELRATLQAITDFKLLDGLRIPSANTEVA